jgi:hypothetical protein
MAFSLVGALFYHIQYLLRQQKMNKMAKILRAAGLLRQPP